MESGYLYLETHPDHPGLLHLVLAGIAPIPPKGAAGGIIRYVARFNDGATAHMRVQSALRRRLVDIDAGIYRVELADAMAAIEAEELNHRRVWLDPDLDEVTLARMAEQAARRRQRRRTLNRVWQAVGAAGLVWLVLSFLLSIA